jgi:hypothetical protein
MISLLNNRTKFTIKLAIKQQQPETGANCAVGTDSEDVTASNIPSKLDATNNWKMNCKTC